MLRRKSLKNVAAKAFDLQNGRCFYCDSPMWRGDSSKHQNSLRISSAQAKWFQCTGEHLVPHSEGGSSGADNIVAACQFCNLQRHRMRVPPRPEQFRQFVQKRVLARRWNRPLLGA
jgi:5-methylcytosine-specific restriction endonuclease McrA